MAEIAGRTGLPVSTALPASPFLDRQLREGGGDLGGAGRQHAVGATEHGVLFVQQVGTPAWLAATIVGTEA